MSRNRIIARELDKGQYYPVTDRSLIDGEPERRPARLGGSKRKKFISEVLDYGVPTAGAVFGNMAMSPYISPALATPAGVYLGSKVRDSIKKYTGYGKKKGGVKLPKISAQDLRDFRDVSISTGLDMVPTVAGYVGTALGNSMTGNAAQIGTKIAREFLRRKTGYGKNKNKSSQFDHAKQLVSMGLDYAVPYGVEKLYNHLDPEDEEDLARPLGRVSRKAVRRITGLGRPSGKKLKELAGHTLDVLVPSVSSTLYERLNPNSDSTAAAVSGRLMGDLARYGIRQLTGVGRGVGKYEPKQKRAMKPNDKRALRGRVLKELMNQGMSFKDASKNVSAYILQHNLN